MLRFFSLYILLTITVSGQCQSNLTLEQCESKFLKNNLSLLAEQYNIDAAKALTIQAKLWDNPVVGAELNAYNPQTKSSFDIGAHGQKSLAIQQLVYLGGKKTKQIEIAKLNEKFAALEFQDLLRNLKFELRQTFYNIYFNKEKISSSTLQISNLDTLVNSYAVQSGKGNVPIKDYVRLQALLIDLKNQKMDLLKANVELQSNMNLLLGDTIAFEPAVEKTYLNHYLKIDNINVFELEQLAIQQRPDFEISSKQIQNNQLNLGLQKSLRVPDVNIGSSWDQHGGAFNNQINLTLGIALPLWNKNQGNIKYAEALTNQSKIDHMATTFKLNAQVQAAYKNWINVVENYTQLNGANVDSYDSVYFGILNNFKKGNISILDFTDFVESYNMLRLHLNELKQNIVVTAEQINTVVNKDVFKN
jgi:cobalt-zinc-cadmium efflux system outer membrane protein